MENVGNVKAATEIRIGAALSIQHRTVNGEQVAASNAGHVLFIEGRSVTRASRLPTSSKSITWRFASWPTGTSSADISPLAPDICEAFRKVMPFESHIVLYPVEISDS
jgi:hypothetical protein